jgi:hypothetical protein
MALDIVLTVGALGTIVLIVAWLWEARENIKNRKVDLHLHFSALYIIGNFLLTVYSWWIQNFIFLTLGLFLLLAIIAETAYAAKIGTVKRK